MSIFWRTASIALLCLTLVVAVGCAPKSTGDDDDDTNDDQPPESGVGSYEIHLNLVTTLIGQTVAPTPIEVYTAAGETALLETIPVADYLAAIEPFAADAAKFDYLFIAADEQATVGPVSLTDLDNAAFYEDAENATLCLGWTTDGADALCGLEGGWIVTQPVAGAFDEMALTELNAYSGDQPAHLGETVAIRAVAHTGTNTVVSGTYVKTYLQQGGYGVKVFADAGATEESQGYDGLLTVEIETFIGDEVFVLGRVTVHGEMIELVPVSAYHLAVLSTGNAVEAPLSATIDQLNDNRTRYAGALVRVDNLDIVDVNPDDPTTDWPAYGAKSKEISIQHLGGGRKMRLPVYENTGLPGSDKPAAGFDVVGAFEIDGSSNLLFPRRVEDINPSDLRLGGSVKVQITGEDESIVVDLDDLPTGLQPLGDAGALVPVVSLAEVVRVANLTRNPRVMSFKPVAYDDRQPFEAVVWEELKSGVLYQDTPQNADQPDPMVSSYFWPELGLSDIYFLRGITKIACFRAVTPPEEGEADYGDGVTLLINGYSFVVSFAGIARTEYNGAEAITVANLLNDQVIELFAMGGSFTTDQIKFLYDYRLVDQSDANEIVVRYGDLAGGYLLLDDMRVVFPALGAAYTLPELLTIDMMRYIQVDLADGGDPVVVYLRDCDTAAVEVETGETADVVYYDTVAVEAGIDAAGFDKYLYDFWLVAADDFISNWSYGHGHFDALYIQPYENRGFTTDFGEHSVGAYGGRASTKAVYEIRLVEVALEAPSIPVVSMIDGTSVVWGTDANTCEGCHWKSDELHLEEINCYSCHGQP